MLGRLGDAVPAGVELGYHLCYGSPRDEHLVQPKDAAILVEMMEGIAAATRRRIDFLHIPGAARTAPTTPTTRRSKDWKRPAGTKLYLGLLHHDDEAGDRTRIAVGAAVMSTISASRPSAAGAAPSPGGCPGC